MSSIQLGAIILLLSVACQADSIIVGPNGTVSRISDAARHAQNGDTVLVTAGIYHGDVAVWRQKRLTIHSLGGRATLIADGMSAEDKATWVIRNGRFDIEGFEFRGARSSSDNGAGIRFERGDLTVTDCVFRDNQMGLLTGNDTRSRLRIRDSWFRDAPRQEGSLPHLLYVGRIGSFEASGSRFENGYRGHLVKSRASRTDLRYNLIVDGMNGQASYEVDLPNGGNATLVGNLIIQSPRSENKTLVAYGAEGISWPRNRLVLAHNTLVNRGEYPASFARIWPERQSTRFPTRIRTLNNLLIGLGDPIDKLPGDHAGDVAIQSARADHELDPRELYSIAKQAREGGVPVATRQLDDALRPTAEPSLPVGRAPIMVDGEWLPGAFQILPQ